ncbi:hypothetical protein TNCV_2060571 [Trichonephila clavipes]|nr:hypothetical protein TNCV_2060571 [Trichonephila clavipes]
MTMLNVLSAGKLRQRSRTTMVEMGSTCRCIAVEMEAIALINSGTSGAREAMPEFIYHHHLSAIFFVESSSCTHTNCNRAMNF